MLLLEFIFWEMIFLYHPIGEAKCNGSTGYWNKSLLRFILPYWHELICNSITQGSHSRNFWRTTQETSSAKSRNRNGLQVAYSLLLMAFFFFFCCMKITKVIQQIFVGALCICFSCSSHGFVIAFAVLVLSIKKAWALTWRLLRHGLNTARKQWTKQIWCTEYSGLYKQMT